MPVYEINIPGRGTFEVNSTSELTDAQAYQAALSQARTEAKDQAVAPSGGMFAGGNVGSSYLRGVRDPIDALAQMLPRALSKGAQFVGATDTAKFLSDEAQRVDALNLAVEQKYQEQRKAQGGDGIDFGRIAGNIVNPINVAAAARAPALVSGGARALSSVPVIGGTASRVAGAASAPLGQAIIGGTAAGLLEPVFDTETKNYSEELAKRGAIGAVAGGVGQKVLSGVGRVLSPQTAPDVRALASQGVQLTPGQILGGGFKKAEESFKSIPLVGSIVEGAEKRSVESFNNAVINESLASIGVKLPKDKIGRNAITFADNAISNAYNKVLGKATVTVDDQLLADLSEITNRTIQELPKERADQLVKIISNKILDKFKTDTINGGQWKQIDSDLGKTAAKYLITTDADQRTLGSALKEAQFSIRNLLERTNPEKAGEIKNANQAFSKFLRVERAASSVGAKEGVFSPSQFLSATKSLDESLRKGRFARGEAVMQDFAEQGKNVLGANLPDSGTANRLLAGGGVVGGLGYLEPTSLLAPLGVAAAYTGPSQELIRRLLLNRPDALRSIGSSMQKTSPLTSNILLPGLLGE
jgi:hypothetical protein